MLFGRNQDPPAPGLEWDRDGPWEAHTARSRRETIEYDGETYVCRLRESPDGSWRIAYGAPGRDGQSRGFLFRDGSLEWTIPLDHPTVGLVADGGAVVFLESGASDRLDGAVRAFDATGARLFYREFDVNVSDAALSGDGQVAAVQTKPSDATTHLFDVPNGKRRLTHASDWASPNYVRLYSSDRTWYAYLSNSLEKKPLYAIDLDGAVVWESRSFQEMKPLSARIKSRLS